MAWYDRFLDVASDLLDAVEDAIAPDAEREPRKVRRRRRKAPQPAPASPQRPRRRRPSRRQLQTENEELRARLEALEARVAAGEPPRPPRPPRRRPSPPPEPRFPRLLGGTWRVVNPENLRARYSDRDIAGAQFFELQRAGVDESLLALVQRSYRVFDLYVADRTP